MTSSVKFAFTVILILKNFSVNDNYNLFNTIHCLNLITL
jgi:hypothetical protein